MTLSNKKVSSILIGGKAGEGVKKAAQVIAKVLLKQSYHVFQADDYQSLIKGGHNFSTISFATEPVYNAYNSADLLISFDKRSMETHWLDFSSSKSLHYYNDNDAKTRHHKPTMHTDWIPSYCFDEANLQLSLQCIHGCNCFVFCLDGMFRSRIGIHY